MVSVAKMRFHWYWPFARVEEMDLAHATIRPGEELVIEVIDRDAAPESGYVDGVVVFRDLPEVNRRVGRAAWLPSRASTYGARWAVRRRHWRSGDFDLFHLHYINRFTDAFALFPQPLVMSVHDVVPHSLRLGRRTEHALLGRLYARPDALIVHHSSLADELRQTFDVEYGKIHVVPHQVFPTGIDVCQPPDGPPRLLFFGALRPNKGLDVLDEVMQLLRGHDIRLTIAGHGDQAMESLAKKMALEDDRITTIIRFVTLGEKRDLFRSASLVVLPYTSFASQSGVIHDAYGHGRPVVVTDVGALGTSVRADCTGLVVQPQNARVFADAVLRLLAASEWDAASSACRSVAGARSPRAVGTLLREIYDHVLEEQQ